MMFLGQQALWHVSKILKNKMNSQSIMQKQSDQSLPSRARSTDIRTYGSSRGAHLYSTIETLFVFWCVASINDITDETEQPNNQKSSTRGGNC